MKHRPRKHFGQNFLKSSAMIDEMLRAFHPQPFDHVVEIGPGLGALTRPLLTVLNVLTAIEIDRDLQARLLAIPEGAGKLKLIDADALTVDYSQWGSNIRIIGNLPYNISTSLLIHLLHYFHHIKDMHFMLQQEVVERLAASPGSKNYGRLSVMLQYYCEVEPLFHVPADAFYPKPKVDSTVVRLVPYRDSPYPFVDFKDLERLMRRAFSMRRKTLANNLKPMLSVDNLHDIGINPKCRPEQISISEYVQIAKFISK